MMGGHAVTYGAIEGGKNDKPDRLLIKNNGQDTLLTNIPAVARASMQFNTSRYLRGHKIGIE
jgi:hypothetical protein